MANVTGVRRATGRERDEWFEVLDRWGAVGREFREIAEWLTGKHGLSRWWAQKLIVEYQQARGVRPPGMRRDGTFEVSASKTIGVSAARALDAFVDAHERKRWLSEDSMSLQSSQEGRSARFGFNGDSTRVSVSVIPKGRSRSTITVAHGRLTDAQGAQVAKSLWKERLIELKSYLESEGS